MLSSGKKIENIVIELLASGPIDTFSLIKMIRIGRPNTTKQAMYKVLKKLKENEIVIHKRNHVALSSVWLNKLSQFVDQTRLNYQSADRPAINFLRLKQGEKISYNFKSFEVTDVFWAHAFDTLSDINPKNVPVLVYNPHEWFLLVRHETEKFIFERLKKLGKKLFIIAGNRTELDLFIAKYFDGKLNDYMASKDNIFPKGNYYVNVFNDFLIEVWLDQKISRLIDDFYANTKTFDTEAEKKLRNIIKLEGKNKLVITRNKRKADKITRIFKKYFLF